MSYVLLHGFTGLPSSWDAVIERLDTCERILRPTLPGHGALSLPVAPWSETIASVIRYLKAERVTGAHLVGYSMGGRLARSIAYAEPKMFDRLTLIGAHPGLATEAERRERREADRPWIELLENRGLPAFVERWERLPIFATQQELSDVCIEAQRRTRLAHNAGSLASALAQLGLAEMPIEKPSTMPVRTVVGELDARHRALAEGIGTPVVLVPDAGHNVVLERPDAIAELLR